MKKKASSLTKSQKLVIILSLLYELIIGLIASNDRYAIQMFIMLSLPCLLYWSGVWIWGFGYILKTIRYPFKNFKIFHNASKPNIRENKEVKKDTNRTLKIIAILLLLVADFIHCYGEGNITSFWIAGTFSAVFLYLVLYFIMFIFTIFMKNKSKREKIISWSICIISVIFIFLQIYWIQRTESAKANENINTERLMNVQQFSKTVSSKQSTEDVSFERYNLRSVIAALEILLPSYDTNSGLSGIMTEKDIELWKTEKGFKKLYDKAKMAVEKVDKLDIKKDMIKVASDCATYVKDRCYKQYPSHVAQCDLVGNAVKQSIESKSDYLVKLFEKKKDVVHAEYEIFKCFNFYKKVNLICRQKFEEHSKLEGEVQKISSNSDAEFVQYVIEKVTAIKID